MAEPISKKSANFDQTEDIYEEPRFLCCFQRIHVRTAAMVIAVLEFLFVLAIIPFNMIMGILMLVVSVGVISSLFWAIHTNDPVLVIPHLIWQGVQALVLISFFLFALVNGSMYLVELNRTRYALIDRLAGEEKTDKVELLLEEMDMKVHSTIGGFIVLQTFFFTFICLNFWWAFVIYRFYEYLKVHGAAGNAAAAKVDANAEVGKVSASAAAKVSASDASKVSTSAAAKVSTSAAAKFSSSDAMGREAED